MTMMPLPPDRHRLHELLERYRPELLALPKQGLMRPQVSRDRAFELTGLLLPGIQALSAQLDNELHADRATERRKQISTLEERALVFYAADLNADETFANTTRERRLELATQVKKHDRVLFNWAVALFSESPTLQKALDDIRPGTGQRDDAEDTLRLVAIFRKHWAKIAGNTSVTMEQLDRAAEDAAELLDLLRPGHLDPARDLARRAYRVWHRDYWELQMLGRYLERADAAGAAQRFPGIRAAANPTNDKTPDDDDDGSTPDSDPPSAETPDDDAASSGRL